MVIEWKHQGGQWKLLKDMSPQSQRGANHMRRETSSWTRVNLVALAPYNPESLSRQRLWPQCPLSSSSLLNCSAWGQPWLTLAVESSLGLGTREVAVLPAPAMLCCSWGQAFRSLLFWDLYTWLWRGRARATNITAIFFKIIVFTWFLHFSPKVHGS